MNKKQARALARFIRGKAVQAAGGAWIVVKVWHGIRIEFVGWSGQDPDLPKGWETL